MLLSLKENQCEARMGVVVGVLGERDPGEIIPEGV
jgi:hypothetical protein